MKVGDGQCEHTHGVWTWAKRSAWHASGRFVVGERLSGGKPSPDLGTTRCLGINVSVEVGNDHYEVLVYGDWLRR